MLPGPPQAADIIPHIQVIFLNQHLVIFMFILPPATLPPLHMVPTPPRPQHVVCCHGNLCHNNLVVRLKTTRHGNGFRGSKGVRYGVRNPGRGAWNPLVDCLLVLEISPTGGI